MSRRSSLYSAPLLLSLLVAPAAVAQDSPGLIFLDKHLEALPDPAIHYRLQNQSLRIATAWRLSFVQANSQARYHRSHLDQDFHVRFALAEDPTLSSSPVTHHGLILPGQELQGTWQLAEPVPEGSAISLKVVAVVYDDGTYEGDPQAVISILLQRAAAFREVSDHLAALRNAPLSAVGLVAEMKAEKSRLQSTTLEAEAEDRPSGSALAVAGATRSELAERLAVVLARPIPPPHTVLSAYIAALEKERQVRSLHAFPQVLAHLLEKQGN